MSKHFKDDTTTPPSWGDVAPDAKINLVGSNTEGLMDMSGHSFYETRERPDPAQLEIAARIYAKKFDGQLAFDMGTGEEWYKETSVERTRIFAKGCLRAAAILLEEYREQ